MSPARPLSGPAASAIGLAGLGCLLLLAATPARAVDGGEFQLFVENDTWSNTDRYYTNGIKLGLGGRIPLLREQAEDLLRQMAPTVPRPGGDDLEFGLFVGHNMYTPKDIKVAEAQPLDRPWAAWLYLGAVTQRVTGNRLDSVEIDVGMVGPAAGGRQIQTEWHKLVGVKRPMGWKNQIPNEAAFLASYLQKRRYGSDSFDIVPRAGVTVGTLATLARAGAVVRAGHNMGGFGPDTIEPGGALLQNLRRQGEASGNEWFGFAGVDHRLVAHNIFLDGTVFRDSPSVGRRVHVYDLSAGLSARWGIFRLSVTRIWRSEEFYTDAGGGGRQRFHSINLGIELP